MKLSRLPDRRSFKHHTVMPRFADAFRGLVHAYRTEPNLRFQLFAGSLAVIAGWAVRLEPWETAYLSATVGAVLVAEVINTAVERTVDLATGGRRHPLAAAAKEVAAGAVLLTALHAVFAGVLLFFVRRSVLTTAVAVFSLLRQYPWAAALPLLTAIMGFTLGSAADDE